MLCFRRSATRLRCDRITLASLSIFCNQDRPMAVAGSPSASRERQHLCGVHYYTVRWKTWPNSQCCTLPGKPTVCSSCPSQRTVGIGFSPPETRGKVTDIPHDQSHSSRSQPEELDALTKTALIELSLSLSGVKTDQLYAKIESKQHKFNWLGFERPSRCG
ncbi:uncharacterized protein BP01DRAFT_199539 [Aspergillus saccharolyticus JOP 1030-1]|uniref:Uncharacterized protein n=1 Tax=Aspergillus saccharolyticus JOP 1030-1 TaxID=1450539 RepID=A0A318ZV15_9EURO|nr:hypothetical protein BP01DRAFT_199539 [Aspergillus saccharolyticus JOP 1030-1]PYH47870.1 hypothetical protein BP01DRAFT_199539 [Aspergillus saccharolyticus JOP 1030-1]